MKLNINYDQLQVDTLFLAEKLSEVVKPNTKLITISRGGLFVGGLLSYTLNIKEVENVSIASYEEDREGANKKVRLLTPFPETNKTQNHIVVDDINDTSETYRFVSQFMKSDWHFATVYHKPRETNETPDFYGREIPVEEWVVFPWDRLR